MCLGHYTVGFGTEAMADAHDAVSLKAQNQLARKPRGESKTDNAHHVQFPIFEFFLLVPKTLGSTGLDSTELEPTTTMSSFGAPHDSRTSRKKTGYHIVSCN